MSSKPKLLAKIDYIRANPVRRNLVAHPGEWPYSSYRYYENADEACLPVTPFEP